MSPREDCPRCGAERPALGACPECGYEDPHPGVLGSYREALTRLREQPSLFVPFLLPTVVLAVTQALLTTIGGGKQVANLPEVAAGLTSLFLQAGWYFVALGAIVPAVDGSEGSIQVPQGPVYVGAVQGALLIVAPWLILAAILLAQPAGTLGAIALLVSVVLLISTIVAAGRALGLPVEAASTGASGLDLFRRGNERARENGGLGLAFLALLLLVTAYVVPGVALAVTYGRPGPLATVGIGSVSSWLVGTWVGVAIGIGLSGGDVAVERSFECPICGEQAQVRGGQATCECGLEGPFYPGERA